jgi:hypothetical protein
MADGVPLSSFDESRIISEVIGETRINDCCTFRWREPLGRGRRVYEIESRHCAECIAELSELAHNVG